MIKAIGYARVSTTDQAQEGISLEAQAAKIQAYAVLNDLDLVEIIEDAGKSGKDTNREGIQKALALIESGEVKAIIVYKLDRLSRKVVDTLTLIERVEKASSAFHSIQEKVDTHSAIGKFFLTITAAFAEMERNVISERTKDALSYKKSQGAYLGAVPYGYQLEGEELTEDQPETESIETILAMRQAGATFQAIATHLNEKGISTKRDRKWYPTTVKNVIERAVA